MLLYEKSFLNFAALKRKVTNKIRGWDLKRHWRQCQTSTDFLMGMKISGFMEKKSSMEYV